MNVDIVSKRGNKLNC